MSGLEINKVVASVLLASLIAMIAGFISNILYKPDLDVKNRGYHIEVAEDGTSLGDKSSDEETPDIEKLMAVANAQNGMQIAKKCISCHSFDKNSPHKVGPNLWNIVNALKGKKDGFVYSKAMASAGGTWDLESLFHFLYKPSKYLPGTKMSFIGIKKYQDIADVIAYLQENSK